MLRYLPNSLTALRLLLALPLGYLILREDYLWALIIGTLAGLSDALDGFVARRLGIFSKLGAALDPIADKILVTVAFICLATVNLVPWYLAAIVIIRDLVIVVGAACYYTLIGPFEFAATRLSKSNMFIQISFCVLVLSAQLLGNIPAVVTQVASIAVIGIAVASGFDYVRSWTRKAINARNAGK